MLVSSSCRSKVASIAYDEISSEHDVKYTKLILERFCWSILFESVPLHINPLSDLPVTRDINPYKSRHWDNPSGFIAELTGY